MLELTSEVSAAKEAASVAQDDFTKEKEEARALGERVSAAEALVNELRENMKNAEEGFLKNKVGVRCVCLVSPCARPSITVCVKRSFQM